MRLWLALGIMAVLGVSPAATAETASLEAKQFMADLMRSERVLGRAFRDKNRAEIASERAELSRLLGRSSSLNGRHAECVSAAQALYNLAIDLASSSDGANLGIRRNSGFFRSAMPKCERGFGVKQSREF